MNAVTFAEPGLRTNARPDPVPQSAPSQADRGIVAVPVEQHMMRIFDVMIALIALIVLLPVMFITAMAVFVTNPGPIIFRHPRIGRDGKMFKCFKFRSMVVNSQELLDALFAKDPAAAQEWARDHKLRNDPRITRIGHFLRKSSIDELPQLVNVLRGEMSIVGPRPIVPSEAARYGRYFDHYCRVRPGLTGLWQVSGRNDTTYRRRVACDVTYVRSQSLKGNVRIMLATVPQVLLRSGSY